MSSAPTEHTANLSDAAKRLLAARQNYATTETPTREEQQQGAPMPDPFSAPTISAITEDPTMYNNMGMPSDPPSVKRQLEAMANDGDNLDLKRNDNAYHVIASIVADRIEYEAQHGKDAEADEVMNSLLPHSLQVSFAEATAFRLRALPAQADIMGESSVDALMYFHAEHNAGHRVIRTCPQQDLHLHY